MTTEELIKELSKYPNQRWYAIEDEDEGIILLSEYTGDIENAQVSISLNKQNEDR